MILDCKQRKVFLFNENVRLIRPLNRSFRSKGYRFLLYKTQDNEIYFKYV